MPWCFGILDRWFRKGPIKRKAAFPAIRGGLTGGYRIVDAGASQTVFDDNEVDHLSGNQGQYWFFSNLVADNGGALDVMTDQAANEMSSDSDV